MSTYLSADALRRALSIRDLTDGGHAMSQLVRSAVSTLANHWDCDARIHRESPIVSVYDNYDALHYPSDGAARNARYTRYINDQAILRTQMSAVIPRLLKTVTEDDELLACPGLVYRRDAIDRMHVGEPHQLDLWRIVSWGGPRMGREDLMEMIELVVKSLLPGRRWRVEDAEHPYTEGGLQIDVEHEGEWVEIGECGLALPKLLDEAGLDATGLAMGLGMDRVLMLRKGISDIRLLRSEDPRVSSQMQDLEPYRPVSNQPAARRDLSIAVTESTNEEDLGDKVREALGDKVDWVEEVAVLSETPRADLPSQAIDRIGLQEGQKNMLVRIVLRHPVRPLEVAEANRLRDQVYAAIHQGCAHQWIAR